MVQAFVYRLLFLIAFNFCFLFSSLAQNYFANGDFEQLNNCSEYHQDCASEAWFYVKPAATALFTPNIVPTPFCGKDLMILPIENVFDHLKKRQFVYTMFCCPLQKGKSYKLSFYVNTIGNAFYGMDFYMRNKEFTSQNFSYDTITASIHVSKNDIVNELGGWNYVEKIYIANGDERFCLLGNLSKQKFEFSSYQRMNKAGDVFYFLDDIVFKPVLPEKLCEAYKANSEKLYAQNFRHTELALVDKLPTFFTDTIIVPAVFFETDKDILKPIFTKLLDSLILKFSNKNIAAIMIEGHTDDRGTLQRNIILSKQRAEKVQEYFIKKVPSLKNTITAAGKANTIPIDNNTTEKGRAKNRRVNIILSYTLLQ